MIIITTNGLQGEELEQGGWVYLHPINDHDSEAYFGRFKSLDENNNLVLEHCLVYERYGNYWLLKEEHVADFAPAQPFPETVLPINGGYKAYNHSLDNVIKGMREHNNHQTLAISDVHERYAEA